MFFTMVEFNYIMGSEKLRKILLSHSLEKAIQLLKYQKYLTETIG